MGVTGDNVDVDTGGTDGTGEGMAGSGGFATWGSRITGLGDGGLMRSQYWKRKVNLFTIYRQLKPIKFNITNWKFWKTIRLD